MKNASSDVFTEMKNEDRKFGEKSGKSMTEKEAKKRQKHAGQQNFSKMRPSDIIAMGNDYDYDEELEAA